MRSLYGHTRPAGTDATYGLTAAEAWALFP